MTYRSFTTPRYTLLLTQRSIVLRRLANSEYVRAIQEENRLVRQLYAALDLTNAAHYVSKAIERGW